MSRLLLANARLFIAVDDTVHIVARYQKELNNRRK